MKNRFNKNKYSLLRGSAQEVIFHYEEEIRIAQDLNRKRTPVIIKHTGVVEV